MPLVIRIFLLKKHSGTNVVLVTRADCNVFMPPNYCYPPPPTMFPHHPMHCSSSSSCSQKIPNLYNFLCALDEEQGKANVFKFFETSFQEEGIKVSHIKDLTDNQLVRLSVTKVG